MATVSAGLVMYRRRSGEVEVLLVHPGGPLWAKKDAGAWSIPKGEVNPGDDEFSTAKREFNEETGVAPEGEFIPLGSVTQKGGKVVRAWAFEGDCDPAVIKSNTFVMEWPPRSGKKQEFPEVDRARFFTLEEAKDKINPAQVAFLQELARRVPRQ
jgi:predicted NUDIX family NTP pyrophosphohydrolase